MEEKENVKTTEETVEQSGDPQADAVSTIMQSLDQDNPTSDKNIKIAENIVKAAYQTAEMMRETWDATARTYQLTNQHMHDLWMFNKAHSTVDPEKKDGDKICDGLLKLGYTNIKEIFGEDHMFTITSSHTGIDGVNELIKSCMEDYYNYIKFSGELQESDRAYRSLLSMRETQDIIDLRKAADAESNPETKQAILDHVNRLCNIKYMDHLREPLSDYDKNNLINAFGDEKKIDYWVKRSAAKMQQMNLSPRTIFALSGFEKIHLPERYHQLNNMMLTYIMMRITYSDVAASGNPKIQENVDKILGMIMAIDGVVRSTESRADIDRIKGNVMAFLEQLIVPVYEKYYPDKPIPELAENTEEVNE